MNKNQETKYNVNFFVQVLIKCTKGKKKSEVKPEYLKLTFSYIGDPFIYRSHGSVCNKMSSNNSLYLLTLYHFQNKLSNLCSKPNKFSQNKSKMFYFLNNEIHNFSTKDEEKPNADFKLILLEAKVNLHSFWEACNATEKINNK